MLPFFLNCERHTESINPKVSKAINGRIMFLSICAVCNSEKPRCFKEQEASRLLSKLSIKTPLSKIPLFCDILL